MNLIDELNETFGLIEDVVYWKGCRLPAGNESYIRYDGVRYVTSSVVKALQQHDASELDAYMDSTAKQNAKTKKLAQYMREWSDAQSAEDAYVIRKAARILERANT